MLPTFSHQGDFVLISPIPTKLHEGSHGLAARGKRAFEDARGAPTPNEGGAVAGAGAGAGGSNTWRKGEKWWKGIHRGDIIIATSPTDPSKTVCKRVIGLEGDIIEIDPSRTSPASRSRNHISPMTSSESIERVKSHRSNSGSFAPGKNTPMKEISPNGEIRTVGYRGERRRTGEGGHAGHTDGDGDGDGGLEEESPATKYDRKNENRWEENDANHRAQQISAASADNLSLSHPNPLDPAHNSTHPSHDSLLLSSPVFSSTLSTRTHIRIPRGYVWIAGDNMSNSTDSRVYGPVPIGLVKGKVLAKIWPEVKWFVGDQERDGGEGAVRLIKDYAE